MRVSSFLLLFRSAAVTQKIFFIVNEDILELRIALITPDRYFMHAVHSEFPVFLNSPAILLSTSYAHGIASPLPHIL